MDVISIYDQLTLHKSFQVALAVKKPPATAGDLRVARSVLGLERSPGGGNGNLLLYSCLEKRMNREPGGLWSIGSQRVRHN